MSIDVHAHCIPPALIQVLQREGGRHGLDIDQVDGRRVLRVAGRPVGAVRDDLVDVDARLVAMDRMGIAVQLVSGWIGITGYSLPIDRATGYVRMFNETLATMVAAHPERLIGLCNVPLQAPEQAAEELQYAVGRLGMAGAEIATTVDGTDLDDPSLEPFWAAAAELGCLILIHPDQVLPGRSAAPYFLNNTVGNAAETTIAVAHLVCSGVLERYPDLRLCLVHGGGYLPYQAGRLDHGYRAHPQLVGSELRRPPSEYLRRLYFDTVTHSPAVLGFLLDFAGPEHVVLGSDYPFEMGDSDPVGTVQAVPGLDDEQRSLIVEGNLTGLLAGITR